MAGLLALFVVLILPGTYTGAHTINESLAFCWDEVFFMMPPLRDLAAGHYPKFASYGNFPAFFVGLLFAPYFIIMRWADSDVPAYHLLVLSRIAQVVIGAVGLAYIFRLARMFCSVAAAAVCVLIVMTSNTFCHWVLTLHPDVYQLASYAAALYYLARYLGGRQTRDWALSAVCAGLSVSSKFMGGVALVPAFAAIYQTRNPARPGDVLSNMLRYTGIAFGVFLALNIHFITDPGEIVAIWTDYGGGHSVASLLGFTSLFKAKIANLSSPQLFGGLFFLVYCGVALRDLSQMRKRGMQPVHLIHLGLLTMLAYYIPFFNDAFNVPDGERYLLFCMALTPIPVAVALEGLARSGDARARAAVYGTAAALLVSQLARITGVGFPLGQGAWFSGPKPRSLASTLSFFYDKELQGRFIIRDWVARNVERGSLIYVESYMNIPSDYKDLPVSKVIYTHVIDQRAVDQAKPDYVFTAKADIAARLADTGKYQRLVTLGEGREGEVYVLRKRAR